VEAPVAVDLEVAAASAVGTVAHPRMAEEVATVVHPRICLGVDTEVDTADALAVTTHINCSLIHQRISIPSLVPAHNKS